MGEARVEVLRGGLLEAVHVLDVAVAGADGALLARAGCPGAPVVARSAIKPLQALPLVEDGAAERFGLGERELAVCCASHSGEPEHVGIVRSMLSRAGLAEDALACGPHPPFARIAASALRESGTAPGRVHNNCSGKHAGMLLLARAHGWPVAGYHERDHPVQRRILAELCRWSGASEPEIGTAIDGCGVVTFSLPLDRLARAMARLVAAADAGAAGPARVVGAMATHPFLVGGTGRLCTRLPEVTGGRVIAKVGAEGIYVALARGRGVGVAVKARDGARRGSETGLLAVLSELGLVAPEEAALLRRWSRPEVRNTRGEVVGEVRGRVSLAREGWHD
jgi:L-asparaginase II